MELRFSGAARVDAFLQQQAPTLKAFSSVSLNVTPHLHLPHLMLQFIILDIFITALFCGASTSMIREMTAPATEQCPKDCVCSGNPDAIRVDCSNLNLTSVPTDIGPMTSILVIRKTAKKIVFIFCKRLYRFDCNRSITFS
ncbi:hypothetical protein NPIL_343311 [Nephila pilipes]|uniref:LRRNT domain-containing protein n=1 Tax=Nephila pilipes TaxID=299642 RepID=A0A8X6NI43_NEPPI|nr:hypothetical protein NPIL_343311 [Nephila pilipes]